MNRRFLLLTLDAAGNWPPELALVRALAERGHAVRVISDASHAAEVEGAGAEYRPYQIVSKRPLAADPSPPKTELEWVLRKWLLNPEFSDELLAEVARDAPDVLLVDAMLLAACAGAESSGLPTATLWHTAYGVALRTPPWVAGPHLAPLHALREGLGLPPAAAAGRSAGGAHAILALTYEAFDTPPEPRPSALHYVGPLACVPRETPPYAGPWPDGDPRPLVLVSYSTSFQNQVETLQRVADALAELPVRGLVTRGPAIPAEALRLPENVAGEPFVAHAAVLPRASLVVTHAGHGTVMAAVTAGVPLVCTPMGRDQYDVAGLVAARGLGVVVPKTASVDEFRRAIAGALGDSALHECCRRFAASVDAPAGLRRAVALLEALRAGGKG